MPTNIFSKKKATKFSVSFDDEHYDKLKKIMKKLHCNNRSDTLRVIVREYQV